MNKRWRLIEKLRNSNETYEKNFMERLGARQRREQAIYEKIYTDMCKNIDVNCPKNWTEEFLSWAHQSSSCSEKRVKEKAKLCGCFYCGTIFSPNEIGDWCDDGFGTPICPHCGIDSVIDDASGFPITKEFLRVMEERFFGGVNWDVKEDDNPRHGSISICRSLKEIEDAFGDVSALNNKVRSEVLHLRPLHNDSYFIEFDFKHSFNIKFFQVKCDEENEGCYIVMISHSLSLADREKYQWKKVSKLYRMETEDKIDVEMVVEMFKKIAYEKGKFNLVQWRDVTMECIEKEVATDEDLQKFFA